MQFLDSSGMQPQVRAHDHMILIYYTLFYTIPSCFYAITDFKISTEIIYLPLPGKPIPFKGVPIIRTYIDPLFCSYFDCL